MIDDQDLGFFANFLGIFIFMMVIAYHYVMADPKYEGNWMDVCALTWGLHPLSIFFSKTTPWPCIHDFKDTANFFMTYQYYLYMCFPLFALILNDSFCYEELMSGSEK